MQNKLENLRQDLARGEFFSYSHAADLVSEAAQRLNDTEMAIIKMVSALETNPTTGDYSVRAIINEIRDRAAAAPHGRGAEPPTPDTNGPATARRATAAEQPPRGRGA